MKTILIVFGLLFSVGCSNFRTDSKSNENTHLDSYLKKNNTKEHPKEIKVIDSMTFELIDSISKNHWFNSFSLVLYSDSTYFFDFKFSGGYSAIETGPYLFKRDSLTLISKEANTKRIFKFVRKIEKAEFQMIEDKTFIGTIFLKAINLNIDWNKNNPKPKE